MKSNYPVIPIEKFVVFPNVEIRIAISSAQSLKAIHESSIKGIYPITSLQQSQANSDEKRLAIVGTKVKLIKHKQDRFNENQILVDVRGISRIAVSGFQQGEGGLIIAMGGQDIETVDDVGKKSTSMKRILSEMLEELSMQIGDLQQYPAKNDWQANLLKIRQTQNLADMLDLVSFYIPFPLNKKQDILSLSNISARFDVVVDSLRKEIEHVRLKNEVFSKTRNITEKKQREYILQEQLKLIKKELNQDTETKEDNEIAKYTKQIQAAGMHKEAKEKALAEVNKLKMIPSMSSEGAVVRTYLDFVISLPWKKTSRARAMSIKQAAKELDNSHYGLEKVKETILENLVVMLKRKKQNQQIMCLVGPPGIGKTSIAESVAKVLGRPFVKIALGGLHDEAEIRGHRKTYIGAMAGRVLQKIQRVGVANPLFLLDEIDKLGSDYRGDPAFALLEVLDPEQNKEFYDNYLETHFDLSKVFFLCTANSLDFSDALRDRLEIIELPSYTLEEKKHIAQNYLLPKQFDKTGWKKGSLEVQDESLEYLIQGYTREPGVRSLDRYLAKLCRHHLLKSEMETNSSLSSSISRLSVNTSDLRDTLRIRFLTLCREWEK